MEIKCKVSFSLPEDLMEALDINDDTPVIASISDGRITVEIADDEDDYTEDIANTSALTVASAFSTDRR